MIPCGCNPSRYLTALGACDTICLWSIADLAPDSPPPNPPETQMKANAKPAKSAPEFKVGDHVVATTGATDNCPATGIVCNIGKGWYMITLDQPEAFPMVKSGKISARAGSMAIYEPKSVEPIVSIEDEDRDDDNEDDVIAEESDGCKMAEQLKAARVRYAKTKRPSGAASADNADAIAKALRDFEPLEVCEIADKVFKLPLGSHEAKYSKLNPGQKRMNSGSRIRGLWRKLWIADDKLEIARVADLVGVALSDDFLDDVAALEMEIACKPVSPDAIPVECIGNVGA